MIYTRVLTSTLSKAKTVPDNLVHLLSCLVSKYTGCDRWWYTSSTAWQFKVILRSFCKGIYRSNQRSLGTCLWICWIATCKRIKGINIHRNYGDTGGGIDGVWIPRNGSAIIIKILKSTVKLHGVCGNLHIFITLVVMFNLIFLQLVTTVLSVAGWKYCHLIGWPDRCVMLFCFWIYLDTMISIH